MTYMSLTTDTQGLWIISIILIISVDNYLCQFINLGHNVSTQKSTSTYTNHISNELYSKNYSDVTHVTTCIYNSTELNISKRNNYNVTNGILRSSLMLKSISVSHSLNDIVNNTTHKNVYTNILDKTSRTQFMITTNTKTNFTNSFVNETSTVVLNSNTTKCMIKKVFETIKNSNLFRNISSKFQETVGNKNVSLIQNGTMRLSNISRYWLSNVKSCMKNVLNKTVMNISASVDNVLIKMQKSSINFVERNISCNYSTVATSQTNLYNISTSNNVTSNVSLASATSSLLKTQNKFITVISDVLRTLIRIKNTSFITSDMKSVTLRSSTTSNPDGSNSQPVTTSGINSKSTSQALFSAMNSTLKLSSQVITDYNIQVGKNITKLFFDRHNFINVTNETIHTSNGTMMNAAGRFLTDCFDQMSKMMHCFTVGELPEPTLNNITFYLYTRKNTNSGELLMFDTDFLDAYDDFTEGYDNNDDVDEEDDDDYDDDENDNMEYYYVDYESPGYYYTGDNLKYRQKRRGTSDVIVNVTNRRRPRRRPIHQSHGLLMAPNREKTDGSGLRNHSGKTRTKNFIIKTNQFKQKQFKSFGTGRSLLSSKYFNVNDKTKIIVHGYTQSHTAEPIVQLKDAYLSRGSFNVILVDWAALAAAPCYNVASKYARSVGGAISDLVAQLLLAGISSKSVHIIGFSLGAQAAGFAGSYFTTGHIERITGLDPALPLFQSKDPDDCLDAGDAHFVDIIHTSHILGHKLPLGHADFYPNGGVKQPGCDKSDFICSHVRGLQLFAESVTSVLAFPSVSCDSWDLFVSGACNKKTVVFMGDACPSKVSGLFYLRTRKDVPFSLHADLNASIALRKDT